MLLVAVIGIGAALALPRLQQRLIRSQVAAGLEVAAIAEASVATAWRNTHRLPVDNAAAGLPPPGQITGEEVGSVAVEDGAIQLRFGRRANAAINGRVLSLRPVLAADAITWLCGDAADPASARPHGINRTDVPERFLPERCRGSG